MKTRVLIVDDAVFMRKMIRNILTEIGCEVVGEAENGIEAREMYTKLAPDVVTMDLVMPKEGGIEALTQIREEDPNAKIIVISAIDQRETLMEAIKAGAVDYLAKPTDADQVEAALCEAFPGAEVMIHQDPHGLDEGPAPLA